VSAAEAIRAARDAGVDITIDGNDLLLEASAPPPASVLDLLYRHKGEIKAFLAAVPSERNDYSPPGDWAPKPETVTLSPIAEPGLQETCATRRGLVVEENGLLLHFCVECGCFGRFGVGVSVRRGRIGRWYCSEHRPWPALSAPRHPQKTAG
jgi:hypothetical protein